MLTAEWGQSARLLDILDNPETTASRQRTILFLLGEIQSEAAFPRLIAALQEPHLIRSSIQALGNFGARARPSLLSILQTSVDSTLQAEAVHSLGHIGGITGDTSLTPLYMKLLEDPQTEISVKIELVLAIGKAPDFRAFPLLAKLENIVWTMRSDNQQLQELRRAIDWSIREVRQGGHTDDY